MPDDVDDRMFFSFNVGSIHFISISTEYYYFLDQYGTEGANAQFDWLVQDLKVQYLIRGETDFEPVMKFSIGILTITGLFNYAWSFQQMIVKKYT